MIGIYKITNKVNNKSYIGQSRTILSRWASHIEAAFAPTDHSYNYPLQRAIRKYGLENFTFEILEQCSIDELNKLEQKWINTYNSEYNQTFGKNYSITTSKLTLEEVQQIQEILINDEQGLIRHQDLATQYNVHIDTIRGINAGRCWVNEMLTYPLHKTRYRGGNRVEGITQELGCCIDCGAIISKNACRCQECHLKFVANKNKPNKEELKVLIKEQPFTTIGRMFDVSDTMVRKWCDQYNLPRTKKAIKLYSAEEWEQL